MTSFFRAAAAGLLVLATAAMPSASARAAACAADAVPPPLGVNRTNLAWAEHYETILAQMRAEGVRDVRLTLDPPFDKSIITVGVATSLGLGVLLNVPLWHEVYVRPGAQQRAGDPAHDMYPIYRLSDLDVARFRKSFAESLATIERIGGRIKAFEIGNEIDWAAFNGDLPLSRPGVRYTPADFDDAPEARRITQGFARYADALQAVRQVLAASDQHRDATLIAAGLSDWGKPPEQGSLLSRELSLALFRKYHVIDRVDALATHVYPHAPAEDPQERFDQVLAGVDRATKQCGSQGKPCWITEWGFPSQGEGCEVADSARLARMRDFQRAAACLKQSRQLAATYLFDWDHGGKYSVFRCGRLMEAGTVLRTPPPR